MATRKPKQGHLSGMEPPSIAELDDAADNYFETMTDRCKLSKTEDEQKTALIEVMKSHRMARYVTADGLVVTVTDKSNVKCKRKAEENGDTDE